MRTRVFLSLLAIAVMLCAFSNYSKKHTDEIIVTLKKGVDNNYKISQNTSKQLDCISCSPLVDGKRFFICKTNSTAKRIVEMFNASKRGFPQIECIEENKSMEIYPLVTSSNSNNTDTTQFHQWAVDGIDNYNPGYWQALDSFGVTGDGAIIGIIDDGVEYFHPDLVDATWQNRGEDINDNGTVLEWDPVSQRYKYDSGDENMLDDDQNGPHPYKYRDDFVGWNFIQVSNQIWHGVWNSHGTHVSGIVGAAHDDMGINGVAPGVQILYAPIASIPGGPPLPAPTIANRLHSILYAIDQGVDIINISWGSSTSSVSSTFYAVINDAADAGVLIVAAAGNGGVSLQDTPVFPASFGSSGIISVCGLDSLGGLWEGSSYGVVRADIAAPAADIISTVNEGGYDYKSGTSMAAPFAAGVAALLIEHHDDTLSAQQIKQMIMCSAKQTPELDTACISGGYIDVLGALEMSVPRSFDISVCLEGAYDPLFGGMRTDLINLNLLPNGQPYDVSPWNYSGDEGRGWKKTDYTIDVVDWVLVSFRADTSKESEFLQVAALLEASGEIDFSSSGCGLFFDEMPVDSAYIVIEHRNHMGIMTPHPVYVNGRSITHDFRITNSYTGGETGGGFGQKQMSDSTWAMFAGDADQSDLPSFQITGSDKSLWFDNNGIFGQYLTPDFNLDGDMSGADKGLWIENNGISSRVPK